MKSDEDPYKKDAIVFFTEPPRIDESYRGGKFISWFQSVFVQGEEVNIKKQAQSVFWALLMIFVYIETKGIMMHAFGDILFWVFSGLFFATILMALGVSVVSFYIWHKERNINNKK